MKIFIISLTLLFMIGMMYVNKYVYSEELVQKEELIQKKEALNNEDRDFIKDVLQGAVRMYVEYGNEYSGQFLRIKEIEALHQLWLSDTDEDKAPGEAIGLLIGVSLGKNIDLNTTAEWFVVSDQYGTELCLEFPNGKQLFPISAVTKRITNEQAFIEGLYNFFIEFENK